MSRDTNIAKLQLELGGSFFEIIEFSLVRFVQGREIKGSYGINVAKVREVVRLPSINPLASKIAGVAGVFELRGVPIPAVDLAVALGDEPREHDKERQIIVTEFSHKRAGFIVDSTRRIRRIGWDKVLPPTTDAGTFINGMTIKDDGEFLFILDLERILMQLENGPIHAHASQPQAGNQFRPAPAARIPEPKGPLVLLVDDSQFIRSGVKQTLMRKGYRVVEAADGMEAFDLLNSNAGASGRDKIQLVVSDVEMPRMDGLSFTKKVRESQELGHIPILLHTSLSGRANQSAGIAVGANGYVIKNDFKTLLELMKEIIGTDGLHTLSA
jgi:two-component system chemotaxis response regulator CheV